MNIIRLLVCTALLCASTLVNAENFSGKVIAVMDGDTLLVLRNGHPVKVRLTGIDAPEKAQPFGTASQQSLAELVKGKQVQVESRAADDYGRLLATIRIGAVNVNHEQVRRGMAWEYSRFHSNKELMALQREAQQARRGLWAGVESIEPSQWRKLHPSTFAADTTASAAAAKANPVNAASQSNSGQCAKKHCSQMSTCDEARDYLTRCGTRTLDGDGDGTPCESLCAPFKKIKQ